MVKKVSTILALIIALASACYFALNGSGEYGYEGAIGDPDSLALEAQELTDSLAKLEKDSILGSVLQETLDDEFDLLDGEDPIDTTHTPPDTLINP